MGFIKGKYEISQYNPRGARLREYILSHGGVELNQGADGSENYLFRDTAVSYLVCGGLMHVGVGTESRRRGAEGRVSNELDRRVFFDKKPIRESYKPRTRTGKRRPKNWWSVTPMRTD